MKAVTVRGHRYKVMDSSRIRRKVDGVRPLGEAVQSDVAVERKVYIPVNGDTKDELDTIIHEFVHLACDLDENAVSCIATSVSNMLWRLNWRKDVDKLWA